MVKIEEKYNFREEKRFLILKVPFQSDQIF